MVHPDPLDKTRWLSLGDACRLLEVTGGTLRQWADTGYLRAYRTPGGHRRFWRDDVLVLTERPAAARNAQQQSDALEGSALRRIRRRLRGEQVARQTWYQGVEEDARGRMRLFGRRLLSLLLQDAPGRRQRQEALAESHLLGQEYGSALAERGVPLQESVAAFVFFRTIVLESTNPSSWRQILELADQVLLGVSESYQKRLGHPESITSAAEP